MNNYFDYKIPTFLLENGSDWKYFKDIMEEYVDTLFAKVMEMYWFRQPDKIPLIA